MRTQRKALVRRLVASHLLLTASSHLPTTIVIAVLWRESGSAGWVAAAVAARAVPYLLPSGLAGALADGCDRRRVTAASGTARTALLGVLAAIMFTPAPPWAVVAVFLAVALAGVPAYPSLAAAVPDQLSGEPCRRAVGLLSAVEVAAWAVGPGLGGLLLPLGPAVAVTVAALGALLGRLLLPPLTGPPVQAGDRRRVRLRRAAVTLFATPTASGWLLQATVANAAAGLVTVLLPSIAGQRWGDHAGAGYGLLTVAFAAGSTVAPLLVRCYPHRALPRTVAGLPLLLLTAPRLPIAAAGLALSAAGMAWVEVTAITRTTAEMPRELRAQAIGLTDSLLIAATAGGGLLAPLATAAAPAVPLGIAAAAVLVIPLLLPLLPHRPTPRAGQHLHPSSVPATDDRSPQPAQVTGIGHWLPRRSALHLRGIPDDRVAQRLSASHQGGS